MRDAMGDGSAGIGGVLVYVAIGEVAAPGGGLVVAEVEVDIHVHLVAGHGALGGGLIVVGADAVPRQGDAADADLQPVEVEVGAAGAEGGDDAAPVGVATGDGTLPDVGVGDGAGGAAGVGIGGGADHAHGHELLRALAVARHLAAEEARDVAQRGLEAIGAGATFAQRLVAGTAAGEEEGRVVGGHVAVHADHVEGVVHGALHDGLELVGGDGGVGGEVAEHRRHVGVDHADTFGRAAEAHGLALHLEFDGDGLGAGVGGHDAAGEVVTAIGPRFDLGDATLDLLHRQRTADDAGGGDEHLRRVEAEPGGGEGGHADGVIQAAGAVGAVGVAAVDDDGLGAVAAALEVVFADADGV